MKSRLRNRLNGESFQLLQAVPKLQLDRYLQRLEAYL